MIVLNFSHPLTPAHLARLAELTGMRVERVIEQMPQFNQVAAFEGQVSAVVAALGLSAVDWQTLPLVVNLPGYAPAAAILVAELHGRMGHFPTIMRLRPAPGAGPQQYEVAEVVNLQAVRDTARERRSGPGGQD